MNKQTSYVATRRENLRKLLYLLQHASIYQTTIRKLALPTRYLLYSCYGEADCRFTRHISCRCRFLEKAFVVMTGQYISQLGSFQY